MSVQTHAAQAPFGAITVYRFVAFANETFEAAKTWRQLRQTRHALYALSDDTLADIGLCRADIEKAIR